MYPQHVRQWINSRGGLSSKMMFLRGRELMSMYPECRDDDWMRWPRTVPSLAPPGIDRAHGADQRHGGHHQVGVTADRGIDEARGERRRGVDEARQRRDVALASAREVARHRPHHEAHKAEMGRRKRA